jgi:serine/threonine-protein kinase
LTDSGLPPTLARAIERYEFAVAKDPLFARGWASLAEVYDYAFPYVGRDPDEDRRRAESAARKAVELDPRSASSHAMLALVLFYLKWDFAGAEASYRRALELDPKNAYAVVELADLLRETGRLEHAAAEVRRVRGLLPGLPVLAVKEAEIQLDQGRPDAAVASATAAIRLKHDSRRAHVALGMAREVKGEHEQALRHYQDALAMHKEDRRALPAYGYLLGVMGRRKEAMDIARKLELMNERVRNCAYQVATVYAGLQDSAKALDWLERAHRTRQQHTPFMAIDYRFRDLRGQQRFQAILNKLGLKLAS